MVRTFDKPNRSGPLTLDVLMRGPMAATVLLGFACGSLGGIFFCSAVGLL